MKGIWGVMAGVLMAGSSLNSFAQDTNTAAIIQQLQKRIEDLEKKVQELQNTKAGDPTATAETNAAPQVKALENKVAALEQERRQDQEAAAAKAKQAPKITVGDQGFGFVSANGNFALQLKGVLQIDSRTYFNDSGTVGNDGFLLRRARPILQGTVFRDFEFQLVPDFGGTSAPQIYDAFLNYRFNAALQLQAGKFKSPIGLEQLQADRDIFFNERSLATDLVPNRDLGVALHGDLFGGIASYTAGIFNGVGDTRNSSGGAFQDNKSVEGRLFFLPFKKSDTAWLKGLGFGVAGSYEDLQFTTNNAGLPSTTGGSLPGYATVGQQQFFAYNPTNRAIVFGDGEHWRLSPQAYWFYGPVGFLGEYVISDQKVSRVSVGTRPTARLENTGWEVSGSWVITGEDAAFSGGVVPRNAFDPRNGHWGALQLVGRYSMLNIDPAAFPLFSDPATSARGAQEWSVGLNWYLNRVVRVDGSFSRTIFSGGGGSGITAPAVVTRQPEEVFFTRIQLAF